MKITLCFVLLFALQSCEQSISPFNIDPAKIYTPTELTSQARGSCDVTHPWEDKTVSVVGHIESLNLFSNKFWLYDDSGRGFVEVYSADPSAQSGRDIYELAKANTGRTITITGVTIGLSMPTMTSCRKSVSVQITDRTAITF